MTIDLQGQSRRLALLSAAVAVWLVGGSGASLKAQAGGTVSDAEVRAEVTASFSEAADKIVALVEAVPAEKFGYRPAEKVRSFSEAAMHVVGANFYFCRALGAAVPADVSLRDLDKETDRAKVLALLRRSIEHTKQAILEANATAWDNKRDLGGGLKTGRAIALQLASHAHEHLGQLIAYARAMGVAPPWSA